MEKVTDITQACFKDQSDFKIAQQNGFSAFVNQNPDYSAELLAKFIDRQMKRCGQPEAPRRVPEERLIALFRNLQSKDSFEQQYVKFFAKRMLYKKSKDDALETAMIEKLKLESGSHFTQRSETIF